MSERVKSVDLHPTEPWLIAGLYNGMIYIYNYQTQTTVKQIEATGQHAIRGVRFIARKQWFVSASDDMNLRVHNLNTLELVHKWEAHSHFIRCVAVHPTQPYILSCSDDMKIKLWSWEKQFSCIRVFEGHSHYVMHVTFNSKDLNTFASASLDRTVKVWGLGSSMPNFTLEGHEDGVNTVDYYLGGDKPYLVSGADDRTVKVWDYQTKACIQTLEGHTDNVTSVVFHPELPLILSASEDGGVRLWNSTTYRLEKPLNYGWDRVWTIATCKGNNGVALGFDKGSMFLKMGKEIPSASMDATGKVLFAKHNQLCGYNLQQAFGTTAGAPPPPGIEDGERLALGVKELGSCEFYPQSLKHNNNGRFIVATGDGEYIIYTALQVRSKKFGNAVDFVWDCNGGFAIRETNGRIVLYDKSFEEVRSFKPDFHAEGMFGGSLLGVRGAGSICLYDWNGCRLVRKIDVNPKQVFWSEGGDQLVIAADSGFYILRYNEDAVLAALEASPQLPPDGIEDAFEVLHEVPEKIRSAVWVGDCFIYSNGQNVIKYCVGRRTDHVAHLDRTMYLLGYLPKVGKLILIDKAYNVVSYTLRLSVVNFQTAVLRGDMDTAKELLPTVPESELQRIAQFLETCDMHEWALELTTDVDHRFDLAIQLKKLDLARDIASKSDSEEKWRQLSDLAMQALDFALVEECMWKSEDYASLLLLYSSNGNATKMMDLATISRQKGKFNVAFSALLSLNQIDACIDLLINTERLAEAAFMARSYAPSRLSEIVSLWKAQLGKVHPRQANCLADPQQYRNLFPELADSLDKEEAWRNSPKFSDVPAANFVHLMNGDIASALAGVSITPTSTKSRDTPAKQNAAIAAPSSPAPRAVSPSPAASPSPSTPSKMVQDASLSSIASSGTPHESRHQHQEPQHEEQVPEEEVYEEVFDSEPQQAHFASQHGEMHAHEQQEQQFDHQHFDDMQDEPAHEPEADQAFFEQPVANAGHANAFGGGPNGHDHVDDFGEDDFASEGAFGAPAAAHHSENFGNAATIPTTQESDLFGDEDDDDLLV